MGWRLFSAGIASLTWALTSFATVDEVAAALPSVRVGPAPLAALDGVPPVHYYLADASGKSIAVEYVDGQLNVHDAPLGVFANAPDYPWHSTNLRNSITISPDPQEIVTRWTATGTQEGELQGFPPTGARVTWTGVNIFRIECGRVAEEWSEVDGLGRLAQLQAAATPTP